MDERADRASRSSISRRIRDSSSISSTNTSSSTNSSSRVPTTGDGDGVPVARCFPGGKVVDGGGRFLEFPPRFIVRCAGKLREREERRKVRDRSLNL